MKIVKWSIAILVGLLFLTIGGILLSKTIFCKPDKEVKKVALPLVKTILSHLEAHGVPDDVMDIDGIPYRLMCNEKIYSIDKNEKARLNFKQVCYFKPNPKYSAMVNPGEPDIIDKLNKIHCDEKSADIKECKDTKDVFRRNAHEYLDFQYSVTLRYSKYNSAASDSDISLHISVENSGLYVKKSVTRETFSFKYNTNEHKWHYINYPSSTTKYYGYGFCGHWNM